MTIRTIGVIGAGVMGRGVSQDLAQAGYDVVLIDVSDEVLERARHEIRNNTRLYRMLHPDAREIGVSEVLGHIRFSTAYDLLERVDFIIENVPERWEIKEPVYRQLEAHCPASCIFAANTSAISITRIASATDRPDRVIGIHFMNPVPMKRMVELIRGYHTSEETVSTARTLLSSMNKECVVVQDMPGFVSNRVLMPMINEAAFLLQDGVASAAEVDTLFRSCFGHKMGPFETADLIGLDTVLNSIEVLHESYADSKYRPCPLLKKMVDAGLHGRKSGHGFYNYKETEQGRQDFGGTRSDQA